MAVQSNGEFTRRRNRKQVSIRHGERIGAIEAKLDQILAKLP